MNVKCSLVLEQYTQSRLMQKSTLLTSAYVVGAALSQHCLHYVEVF